MPKRTEHPSAAVRIRVMKRDRFQCAYCGTPGTDAELEIDHIIPVSRGGSNHMSNLTTACRACNQTKSNGTLGPMIKAKQASGLVGIYINTFENKKIKYMGQIIGIDGDMCLIQLYSWLSGCPTNVVGLPKADIYNQEKCRMYIDLETADRDAEKESRRFYA